MVQKNRSHELILLPSHISRSRSGMVQAVIFDMDGVMLDTEKVATRAWKQTFAELGHILTDELNLAMIGRNEPDSNAIIQRAMGAGFPVERCRRKANARYMALLKKEGVPLKRGIVELLDFLAQRMIALAVATSTPRALALSKLRQAGLDTWFSAIVAGDDVARGKPEPDLFLAAARRVNAAPGCCVVLEDSPAGIRAGQAAGMIPIMVPDMIQPDDSLRRLAYAVVPSLGEAKQIISDLMKKP
jgi:HAD superfamily hydrolase (TIGR01509 family)